MYLIFCLFFAIVSGNGLLSFKVNNATKQNDDHIFLKIGDPFRLDCMKTSEKIDIIRWDRYFYEEKYYVRPVALGLKSMNERMATLKYLVTTCDHHQEYSCGTKTDKISVFIIVYNPDSGKYCKPFLCPYIPQKNTVFWTQQNRYMNPNGTIVIDDTKSTNFPIEMCYMGYEMSNNASDLSPYITVSLNHEYRFSISTMNKNNHSQNEFKMTWRKEEERFYVTLEVRYDRDFGDSERWVFLRLAPHGFGFRVTRLIYQHGRSKPIPQINPPYLPQIDVSENCARWVQPKLPPTTALETGLAVSYALAGIVIGACLFLFGYRLRRKIGKKLHNNKRKYNVNGKKEKKDSDIESNKGPEEETTLNDEPGVTARINPFDKIIKDNRGVKVNMGDDIE